MVERAHRQLKDALRAHEAGADWPDHLAWVLLGLRAAPKESSELSSAQLVFGQPLILPGELKDVHEAPPDLFNSLLQSPEPPPTCQPRTYVDVAFSPPQVPVHLQQAPFVYIRRGGTIPPLSQVYVGPYCVQHADPKSFKLEIGPTCESVSVDRLKPHSHRPPAGEPSCPRKERTA